MTTSVDIAQGWDLTVDNRVMALDRLRLGRRARGRRRDPERGFTVVEVMVAFSLLVVMIVPAIALVQSSVKVSGDVRNRVVASNLESQQLEITKAMQFSLIPKPPSADLTFARVVGTFTYSVHQHTAWVSQTGSASACGTAVGAIALPPVLLIHIWVTWPGMGATTPPTADTTITPTFGAYAITTGNIAVNLTDVLGKPVANVPVTITDSASPPVTTGPYVTDSTGCAFIAYLAAGAYTVTAQQPGYLGQQEQSPANPTSTPVTLLASTTLGVPIAYAPAAILPIAFLASVPAPPANMPITVQNNALIPNPPGTHVFTPPLGATFSSIPLWPYTNGYAIWAGGCPGSTPATPPAAANVTAPIAAYTVALHELDVTVVNGTTPIGNATVTATEVDSACVSPASTAFYTLAPTTAVTTPTTTTVAPTTTTIVATTTTTGTSTTTGATTTTTVPATTTTTVAAGQGVSKTGMPLGKFIITATAPGFTSAIPQTVVIGSGGPYTATIKIS